MLPFPHLLLFFPICILAALFMTIAAVHLIIAITGRARPVPPGRRAEPRRSAQIIYFRPRQSALPSGLNIGLR